MHAETSPFKTRAFLAHYDKGASDMGKYIMAIDQGTTSTRAIIFNEKSEVVSEANKEIEQIYPKPGWVEHDPN